MCLLQAPLPETVTQTSLVLDDFDVLGSSAQRHSRTSFDLIGAKSFGKRTTEMSDILQSPRVHTVHWGITDKFISSPG